MTYQDDLQDDQLHAAMRSAIGVEPAMRSLPMDDLARGRTKLRHRRIGIAASIAAVASVVVLVLAVAPNGLTAEPDTSGVVEQPDEERSAPFDIAVLEQAVRDGLERNGASRWTDVEGGGGGNSDTTEVISAAVQARWAEPGAQGRAGDLSAVFSLSIADPAAFPNAEMRESCADPAGSYGLLEFTCQPRALSVGGSVLVGTGEVYGQKGLSIRFERADGEVIWAAVIMYRRGHGVGYEPSHKPLPDLPVTVEQLIELVQDPRVDL